MAFEDNERLQEFVLVAGDKVSLVSKRWWFALIITIIGAIPLYQVTKTSFVKLALVNYEVPRIIHNPTDKQDLEITGKGVLDLGNNYYSAFVKVRNLEHDWGVASQRYEAEFKTLGGTSITKVSGSTFVLPAKEKLIVFSRFESPQKPEQFIFNLVETNFIHKPQIDFDYVIERTSVINSSSGIVVSAAIKNLTPFTVKEVSLPVAVYNNKNQIVAVNFTNINDLLSSETRTFQYSPTSNIVGSGSLRAEISAEVNIFDRNVFQVEAGGPSF